MARLEHLNVTVKDPDATAAMLIRLFDWKVRWKGATIHGGRTVHVGSDDDYIALYTGPGDDPLAGGDDSYVTIGGLNHIGVVVENLDAVEAAVSEMGFETHSHADYEPGRRFYFTDADGVEYEVVCYHE